MQVRRSAKAVQQHTPTPGVIVAEVSRFFGIVIGMFYSEHGVPHFHAVHGEHHIAVEIESGDIHGHFPLRYRRIVLAWMGLHQQELLENWNRARAGLPLAPIPPLE